MGEPQTETPVVHFLNVGGLDLAPLCRANGGAGPRAKVTALIERVTCPDCARLLNAMLAVELNQTQRRR